MIVYAAYKTTVSKAALRISKPAPTWTPVVVRKARTGQIKALPGYTIQRRTP